MPAAVIGGAIAAVGSVGAAVVGSSGASKAAAATTQAADQAASVQRENYNRSAAALAPWQQSGLAANNQINALLGIGGTTGGQPGAVDWAGYVNGNPDALANWNAIRGNSAGAQFGGDIGSFGQYHYAADGSRRNLTPYTASAPGNQNAQSAFDTFRNSTGYQFRLNQGLNALNSGYAAGGSIKSGAAMKAINDYGQGMASQEFGNYLAALGNQQSLGFGAASAQAGVGQNTANSLAQIYQNRGDGLANAALVKAQNTGNAINSLFGMAGGLYGRYG